LLKTHLFTTAYGHKRL